MTDTDVKNRKKVWILERNDTPLKLYEEEEDGKKDPYTFVGPCAEFESVNENERMYNKEDYLEHINTYLKEEIDENSLLGELDHNEDYMVSMKNVSHMIKGLWYDDKAGQVMIKIKLLNTRDGKDARAIADEGAPIYISSRASGYIDDDGNVTLERIYTYDIVYRPGFKNAKLDKLNEKYGIKSKSIALYEWNGKIMIRDNKSNKNNMEEYATKEDLQGIQEGFEQYTKDLGKTLDTFKNTIVSKLGESKNLHIASGKNNFGELRNLNESSVSYQNKKEDVLKISRVDEGLFDIHIFHAGEKTGFFTKENIDEKEVVKLANKHDFPISEQMMSDNPPSNVPPKPADEEPTTQDAGLIQKIEDLQNELENGIADKEAMLDYIQMSTDRVNGHGDYMNKISAFCNKMADFMDKVAARVNVVSDYGEMAVERINDMTEYSGMTAQRVNKLTDYANKTTKRVNEITDYSEKIAENQNKLRAYSKNLNESLKGMGKSGNARLKRVIENKLGNQSDMILEKGAITKLTDTVLESVKKMGTDRNAIILETKYPFVKHLNKETYKLFENLDEIKRKRVSSEVKNKKSLTDQEVVDVISQVNEDNAAYRLLKNIPKKYVPVWESLTDKMKNQIIALSKTRDLRGDYEMELFWESLDFGDRVQNISEDLSAIEVPTLSTSVAENLGYSDDDIDRSLSID